MSRPLSPDDAAREIKPSPPAAGRRPAASQPVANSPLFPPIARGFPLPPHDRNATHPRAMAASSSAPAPAPAPAPADTYDIPWVEKYRPNRVADVVGNSDAVARLEVIARDGNMPNLILSVSDISSNTLPAAQQGTA